MSQDSTFDKYWQKTISSNTKNLRGFLASIKALIKANNLLPEYTKINKSLNSFFKKEFQIKKFQEVEEELSLISNEADRLIKNLFPGCFIHSHMLRSLTFYAPFYKHLRSKERVYPQNLSAGELAAIKNKYNLLPKMAQKDSIFFTEDEPDISLHPEWKRCFLANYLRAYKVTRDYLASQPKEGKVYKNKPYTILISTHSPFLLSDLQEENIIFLEKDLNGHVIAREKIKKTFAANIGEMFYEHFFMTETIGEFSKYIIENQLGRIDEGLKINEKDEIKKIFNLVGDELLRKLLHKRLEQAKIK